MGHLKNRALQDENTDEKESDESTHQLGLQRMMGQVYQENRIYEAFYFFMLMMKYVVGEDEDQDKEMDLDFVKKPQPPRRTLQKELKALVSCRLQQASDGGNISNL